jgi:hypothetical protein
MKTAFGGVSASRAGTSEKGANGTAPHLGAGTAVPGDPGYALHAAELEFNHPESGERVTVARAGPQPT